MYDVYCVGNDNLRDDRIKKLENIFHSFNLKFTKENRGEKKIVYEFYDYKCFTKLNKKRFKIQKEIMKDNLLIHTITGFFVELEDEYYDTLIRKSINDEILYSYSTCYRMLQGKTSHMFSHDYIELMQFLLNKKLIKCRLIEKTYAPKEYIKKITNNDFNAESYHGRLRKYRSEKHKVTVMPVKISPAFIIGELISGQKCISYTNMHPYAISYEASEDFLKFIITNKEELEMIMHSYKRNFNEAINSNLIGF